MSPRSAPVSAFARSGATLRRVAHSRTPWRTRWPSGWGWPGERVVATPLGVDHTARTALDPRSQAPRGGGRARRALHLHGRAVETRKNLGVILEALERLGADAPRWKIAGIPGEGVEAFEARVAGSAASERVERLGHLPRGAAGSPDACLAFVLVPHDEGRARAPGGHGRGCAAISSDVPVVREVCEAAPSWWTPGPGGPGRRSGGPWGPAAAGRRPLTRRSSPGRGPLSGPSRPIGSRLAEARRRGRSPSGAGRPSGHPPGST